jgi:hypothetical protein
MAVRDWDIRPPPGRDANPLTTLLFVQDDVISRRQALRHMSGDALRHRLATGRWQTAHPGVYVAHSGPISADQRRWIAVLAAGSGRPALLGGVSALQQVGFRWRHGGGIHVVLPAGRREGNPPPGVVVHRTSHLPLGDVHRVALPPCTLPPRSVVDAAQWAPTDDRAREVIAAAFQQGLVIRQEVDGGLARLPRAKRRALIAATALDAEAGSHSLPELNFVGLCRGGGLPKPTRQVIRTDRRGGRRYLDVLFEEWKVQVEIDGAQHTDVGQWWADMRRQNDLWISGVRFPAWVVRERPNDVIAQVRAALIAAGWRP